MGKAKITCVKCGQNKTDDKGYWIEYFEIRKEMYCTDCAIPIYNEIMAIPVTTTSNFDGFRITKYISVESVEVVIGTGFWSEFTGEWQDAFGMRSTEFEKKMQQAKATAFQKLKKVAYDLEATAIVGADIDYTEFSGNRIGVIVNGTLVQLEKI
jgi:uncharacterized protein YbjQ (UPF0145 family)